MLKTDNQKKLAEVSSLLHKTLLKSRGFKKRRNAFNHLTSEAITQVISFQGGSHESLAKYIPSIEDIPDQYYGSFTVNLGIYIPEVYELASESVWTHGDFIKESMCQIRARLGEITHGKDVWYKLDNVDTDSISQEIASLLEGYGLPFFESIDTREKLEAYLIYEARDNRRFATNPLLDLMYMSLKKGDRLHAQKYLQEQYDNSFDHKPHREHLMELATKLGLEIDNIA